MVGDDGIEPRPPPCKGGALPAELITHFGIHIFTRNLAGEKVVGDDGIERRPPPCKGGALPAELITHFSFLATRRRLHKVVGG